MKVLTQSAPLLQDTRTSRILFSHSNGFPARSYRYFFEMLSPTHLRYVPQHGHTIPQSSIKNWNVLSDELISLIRREHTPYIGIGHSMGAVLMLRAYYQYPEAFSHLFLMDPPLFSRPIQLGLWLVHMMGLGNRLIPHARRAKRRRTQWQSRAEAKTYFMQRKLFKNFHPQSLQEYITHGLQKTYDGSYRLRFSAAVEHKIFSKVPSCLPLKPIHIPSYYLYSTSHSVTSSKNISYLAKQLPTTQFIPVQGGHMFPLEHPKQVADLIHTLLCKSTDISI